MRILHIVGTLDPAAGGPSTLIRTMAASATPDVSFEAVTEDLATATFLAEIPFPVHAFGRRGSTGQLAKGWFAPGMLPWLRANRDRFDGVIVHGLWEYACMAARLAFAGRIPVLVFPHGMLDPYFARAHRWKHRRKQLYWWLVAFWNLRSATRVLFTTTAERQLARRTFFPAQWRAATTPLGCEPASPDGPVLRQAFFAHCPRLTTNSRYLLFLGRIDPKKGCWMLVQAFASIAALDPGLQLVIAGPDAADHTAKLRALAETSSIAERVHFPGMLHGDAKWGALAACEAFVLPSHQENFGIAVVEALASARPVLLSDQVNTAAEIVAAGAGYAAPDTGAGTMSLLQQWLTTTTEERAAMSAHALQLYEDRFTMRVNLNNILRLFTAKESASSLAAPAHGSVSS